MHGIYHEIIPMDDLDFLREEAKRLLITDNCRCKKAKINPLRLDFKASACFQEMISCIQERINYEKKVNNHTPVPASPSKRTKEPAVLEVDLAE